MWMTPSSSGNSVSYKVQTFSKILQIQKKFFTSSSTAHVQCVFTLRSWNTFVQPWEYSTPKCSSRGGQGHLCSPTPQCTTMTFVPALDPFPSPQEMSKGLSELTANLYGHKVLLTTRSPRHFSPQYMALLPW